MFDSRLGQLFATATCILIVSAGCHDFSGRMEWQGGEPANRISDSTSREPASADNLRSRAGLLIQSQAASLKATGRSEIFGRYDEIPRGYQVFALLDSPYGVFVQWPPARLDAARKTFSQRNVRIGNEITSLHVALVDPATCRLFERRAARSDWSAIHVLPEGVIVCDTIELGSVVH